MYELFIANKNYSSWSLRPWVLMRELAIPFTERRVRFESEDNWTRFREFAPNGQVPCLHDGVAVVWDSLGITTYLAEKHDGIWPLEAQARTWARCAAAEMHSGFSALRNRCGMNCGLRIRLDAIPAALSRDIARIDELWTEGLGRFGGPFLGGAAFSAVDAFFAPVAFRVQTFGLSLSEGSANYAQRLLAMPSLQQWYADALAEPFRDDIHEREARASGTIVEDLRLAMV